MKFPPINLFSKPIQEEYERMLYRFEYIKYVRSELNNSIEQSKRHDDQLKHIQGKTEKRLADLNFIYYTRTGRFL